MRRTTGEDRILIVGGSSGMGLALAQQLLAGGAEVIIVGRDERKLAIAQQQLAENVSAISCDISKEDQVAQPFSELGELDHIVSTAADIDGAYKLLPEVDLAAAQRVVESKLYGPLLLAKYGAPRLRKSGSLTFTSGIAAYRPSTRGSIVAAVNAALEGLVRAVAVEMAPIRVNAISPGWVDTPI